MNNTDMEKETAQQAEEQQPEPQQPEPQQAAEQQPEQACAQPAEEAASDRTAELEKQLSELDDRYRRMLAEYDNFRKRSSKEREGTYAEAFASAAALFLPVLDNLERAAQQQCQDAEYRKGVEMIVRQFFDILEKAGITPVGEAGEDFSPELHNAIMHVDDDSMGENKVCEVLLRGFRRGDRVLRHAMVKVAN